MGIEGFSGRKSREKGAQEPILEDVLAALKRKLGSTSGPETPSELGGEDSLQFELGERDRVALREALEPHLQSKNEG